MLKPCKNLIVSTLFSLVLTSMTAQIYTPGGLIQGATNNSWVGIGTQSPSASTHIFNRNDVAFLIDAGNAEILGGGISSTSYPMELRFSDIPSGIGTNLLRLRLHNSGRLDLGADFSSYNVFNSTRLNLTGGIQVFDIANTFSHLSVNRLRWSSNQQFYFSFYDHIGQSDQDLLVLDPQGPSYLSGSLGINTAESPIGYSLFVGGNVLCTELTVKLVSEWPDYVFTDSYNRMGLLATEAYINEFGRLPKMPSAEEVAEKGIEIGELNALLLEKIEELTLELIELRKEVDQLKSE